MDLPVLEVPLELSRLLAAELSGMFLHAQRGPEILLVEQAIVVV
jgi:hypothetical protein